MRRVWRKESKPSFGAFVFFALAFYKAAASRAQYKYCFGNAGSCHPVARRRSSVIAGTGYNKRGFPKKRRQRLLRQQNVCEVVQVAPLPFYTQFYLICRKISIFQNEIFACFVPKRRQPICFLEFTVKIHTSLCGKSRNTVCKSGSRCRSTKKHAITSVFDFTKCIRKYDTCHVFSDVI